MNQPRPFETPRPRYEAPATIGTALPPSKPAACEASLCAFGCYLPDCFCNLGFVFAPELIHSPFTPLRQARSDNSRFVIYNVHHHL
jgi:hypothetical protein